MKNPIQANRSCSLVIGLIIFGIICILICSDSGNTKTDSSSSIKNETNAEKTFLALATESGTDKVGFHHYECVYEEALAPYRHVRGLKVLEIGLGCGMPYGPGASMNLWSNYFTDAQIYFLEYDRLCGQQWHARLAGRKPIMIYGDQANVTLLQQMASIHAPWDIIIDDGGHSMNQQITSFRQLFPAVAPGGTYFLEDYASSLNPDVGGTVNGLSTNGSETAINLMAEVFASSLQKYPPGINLDHLRCCDEICAFRTIKQNLFRFA